MVWRFGLAVCATAGNAAIPIAIIAINVDNVRFIITSQTN
jgi:hypothetical protein